MPRIHAHDPFQIELKHAIPLANAAPHVMDLWVWLPGQLGVDANGFHKDDFYDDLTAYVRFHVPPVAVRGIRDRTAGPLAQAWELLAEARSGDAAAVATVTRVLRTYAAAFRGVYRDRLRACIAGEGDCVSVAGALLSESREALAEWRLVRAEWLAAGVAPGTFTVVVSAVDDFLSTQVLEAWYTLHGAVQDAALRSGLAEAIRDETRERVSLGHQGELDPADVLVNERFVTRLNALKKFVLGVLHVRLRADRRAQLVRDMLFAIAAAIAMLVALILQVWTMWTVGMPSGPGPALFAFIAAGVGGYILKDRTKDWLKGWFAAKVPSWLHDRRVLLLAEGDDGSARWRRLASEPGLRMLGAVEETVRLVSPGEVPAELAAMRARSEDAVTEGERANEDVIHYRRRTVVHSGAARPDMVALDAIVRVGVHRWLRRMDDPSRTLFQVQADGSVLRIKAARTYRAHAVACTPEGMTHVVVVLTRKGIQRVDIVTP
jgi:hypothetical protein